MEFLLKMQIQSGERAGMAHHKIHDREWTALGMAPHEDKIPRLLYPPSTTGTSHSPGCLPTWTKRAPPLPKANTPRRPLHQRQRLRPRRNPQAKRHARPKEDAKSRQDGPRVI